MCCMMRRNYFEGALILIKQRIIGMSDEIILDFI